MVFRHASTPLLVGCHLDVRAQLVVQVAFEDAQAYAVWAGLGTAAVAVIGCLWLGESMDWLKASFLLLIVLGVVGLNLVSSHG